MSRTAKEPIEAAELQVGQDHDFTIPTEGDARVVEEGTIQIVDGPRALRYKDKAEALKFMEEKVVVRLSESTSQNDVNPVEISVNGRGIVLWRGFDYIIARKYLERLARAKTTRFSQEAIQDESGARGYKHHRKTAHTFPYSVIRDDNPLGRPWHTKICAEP